MKVLYIGVYRDGTGWGEAARGYILSLDAAGIKVVPRPLKLHPEMSRPPDRILELEKNSSSGCDVVIQHLLPHHFDYNGHFKKNIGLFASETDSFLYTHWPERLKLMDEVWVINQQQRQATVNSVGLRRLNVVPHACDITRFQRSYKPLDKVQDVLNGNFTFYTIGDLVRRKNLPALIKAFHLEFHPSEPVSLVIKASKAGLSPDESAKHIGAMCDDIKSSLKLHRDISTYHHEIVITRRFTDEELLRLHATCDCFVSPSFGEAWCAIAGTPVDLAYGSIPIENVGVGDFVFTHLGRSKKVTQKLSRHYEGDVISIKPHGLSEELTFTPEHPHYIVQRNGRRKYQDVSLRPCFLRAEYVEKGDFWVVPKLTPLSRDIDAINISSFVEAASTLTQRGTIQCKSSYCVSSQESIKEIASKLGCSFQYVSKVLHGKSKRTELARRVLYYIEQHEIVRREPTEIPDRIELTPDFMFFIGHYLAEGWSETSKNGLATHATEWLGRIISQKAIKDAFGLVATITCKGNKSKLLFNNSCVSALLRTICGDGGANKRIHPTLKRAKNIEYLVKGYFYGDGCLSGKKLSMTTVSKLLARDMVEICNRMGIFVAVSIDKRRNDSWCYNLIVPSQHHRRFFDAINPCKYNEELVCPSFDGQQFLIEDDRAFYLPIQAVRRVPYKGMVHNLSIEDDESYTVCGYATHNCIPAFDAMAMGKTPIVTDCGGFRDYLSRDSGWLVPGRLEPVFGEKDTFADLFTGYEKWTAIDVDKLRFAMREAYEDNRLRRQKAEAGIDRAYAFTYEQVGQVMKGLLDGSQATAETSGAGRREQDEQDFCSTKASPGDGEPADVY